MFILAFSFLKNDKLTVLNLSLNLLDEKSKDTIERFLTNSIENFCIVLEHNKLEEKTKEKLKKKFPKKIFI